jgi:hypothetical protein
LAIQLENLNEEIENYLSQNSDKMTDTLANYLKYFQKSIDNFRKNYQKRISQLTQKIEIEHDENSTASKFRKELL